MNITHEWWITNIIPCHCTSWLGGTWFMGETSCDFIADFSFWYLKFSSNNEYLYNCILNSIHIIEARDTQLVILHLHSDLRRRWILNLKWLAFYYVFTVYTTTFLLSHLEFWIIIFISMRVSWITEYYAVG